MALSDRIAVMYEGEIVGTVDADKISREELGLLMAGARLKEEVPQEAAVQDAKGGVTGG
jgi:simple sugar transport system ATP-binding protein